MLGQASTTGDADGETLAEVDESSISESRVQNAIEAFRGEIEQIPSMYSAIKQDGKPLY